MRKIISVLICYILLACIFAPSTSAKQTNGKVFLVVADKVSLQEWLEISDGNFEKLTESGATALVNTATGGLRFAANEYATIGAGARVSATRGGGLAFNTWENINGVDADKLFTARLGITPEAQNIINPYLPQISEQNQKVKYSFTVGALGTELTQAGYKTWVWGNADTDEDMHRYGSLIAMNNKGIVYGGLVDNDSILTQDDRSLYGIKTDFNKLWIDIDQHWDEIDLAVIDLGDTARADMGGNFALPQVAKAHKEKAVKEADQFIGDLVQRINPEEDLLMVLSATPSDWSISNKYWYAPLLMYGKGIEHGVLTSGTTKRQGIVANIDIAPTIIQFFGIPAGSNMYGRAISVNDKAATVYDLLDLEQQGNTIFKARTPLVQGFIILVILVLLIGLSSVFAKKPYYRWIQTALLWLMSVPVAFLLSALNFPNNVVLLGVEIVLIAACISVIVWLIARFDILSAYIFITLFTALVILIDIVLGSPLMKSSVLGYDAMVGARFYGIGNEFMGVLIGTSIVGMCTLIERFSKSKKVVLLGVVCYFLCTTFLMAAPNYGTNVGGTIAAVVGFLVATMLLYKIKINWRSASLIGTVVIVVLLAFIAFDLTRSVEHQSHIGRTASLILANGPEEIINIITRKLAVNVRLIMSITVWARVFLVSLLAITVLSIRPIGIMTTVKANYPSFYIGIVATIISSIAALIFNDSGIVAAGTMMIYPVSALLYLVLAEVNKP